MYARIRTAAISALLLTLATAACDNTTAPGDLGDLDPTAATDALSALLDPADGISGPATALESAFPTLVDQGLSFRRSRPAADLVFPAGIRGGTFVYDALGSAWSLDTTRTGAPTGGVRVIWYQTDAQNNLILPLVEQGYIDLTDEDAGEPLSQLGVRIVETGESGDLVLSDLTQGIEISDSAGTQHFESEGYYGGPGDIVNFTITSDFADDSVSGDQTFTLVIHAQGSGTEYTLAVDGTQSGDTGTLEENVTATLVRVEGVTELDFDLFVTADQDQSGSGTVSQDGTVRVNIDVVGGGTFKYTDASGHGLSPGQTSSMDALVRGLFLSGLNLFVQLPLVLSPGT